jgi:membrane-associated protease RseP (regulator of RpoE activity)
MLGFTLTPPPPPSPPSLPAPPAEPVRTKSNGSRGTAAAAAAVNRAGIGIIVNDADDAGAFIVSTVPPLPSRAHLLTHVAFAKLCALHPTSPLSHVSHSALSQVREASPAEKAGLMDNDEIVSVDGTPPPPPLQPNTKPLTISAMVCPQSRVCAGVPVSGMTLSTLSQSITGPVGSRVALGIHASRATHLSHVNCAAGIRRNGSLLSVSATRAVAMLPSSSSSSAAAAYAAAAAAGGGAAVAPSSAADTGMDDAVGKRTKSLLSWPIFRWCVTCDV